MMGKCSQELENAIRLYRGIRGCRIKFIKIKKSQVHEYALEMARGRLPYEYCRDAILSGGVYFKFNLLRVVP